MTIPLVALQTETGNALGSFMRGKADALGLQRSKLQNQSAQQDIVRGAMDMFGSVALGAMGGKLDGEVDPQRYEQGLDWLASQGMDISELKGKPDLAPVLARGSLGVLQAINMNKGDEEMQLRLKQFDMQMQQAAQQSRLTDLKIQQTENLLAGKGPAPTGFRYTEDGNLEPVTGGPDDPAYLGEVAEQKAKGKPKKYTDLPVNVQKKIAEADEVVRASVNSIDTLQEALKLSRDAYEGPTAGTRGAITGLFGNESGQATSQLDNLIKGNALESLKAVFGGMPTEGERKILIEIQGSSDQKQEVREAIYTRAIAAAMARIDYNKRMAKALRDGSYFDEGFDAQPSGYQSYMPQARIIADQIKNAQKTVEGKDEKRLTVDPIPEGATVNKTATGIPWSVR